MIDNSLKQEPKKPIVGKMVTFRWEGTPNRALAKGSFIQLLDLKILFLKLVWRISGDLFYKFYLRIKDKKLWNFPSLEIVNKF